MSKLLLSPYDVSLHAESIDVRNRGAEFFHPTFDADLFRHLPVALHKTRYAVIVQVTLVGIHANVQVDNITRVLVPNGERCVEFGDNAFEWVEQFKCSDRSLKVVSRVYHRAEREYFAPYKVFEIKIVIGRGTENTGPYDRKWLTGDLLTGGYGDFSFEKGAFENKILREKCGPVFDSDLCTRRIMNKTEPGRSC